MLSCDHLRQMSGGRESAIRRRFETRLSFSRIFLSNIETEKERDEEEASAARQKQERHVASCRATAKETTKLYNRQ